MCAVYAQSDPQRPQPGGAPAPVTSSGSERSEARGAPVIIYGDEDYKLAPRDVIEVIVDAAPELSVNYTINSKGIIPLRFLGPLSAAGKTTEEVSKIIADGLRGRYLQDPQVYVSVKQYNSRTFFIQGAVRNPGVYVISGKPSLFRLTTIAGGLDDNHGLVAYIFRETPPKPEKLEAGPSQAGASQTGPSQTDPSQTVSSQAGDKNQLNQIINQAKAEANGMTDGTGPAPVIEGEPDYEIITANLGGVLRGRLDNNIIVQPGDLVYIPPSDVFYVAGEVKAPGQFHLRQGITLRQAISLAGGTLFKARLSKGIIFRSDPVTGNFTEMPVDIGDVMSGKSPDLPIMGNDVVWVPNSSAKSIGATVLNTLIPNAVYRIPYPR
ncbi:MAG TPA: polysaccharide biosynthesis/export family protein [Blastocatellia bacterium]|nr:polysaccharide biosynthesis/export family protein [Blastocatellia bacterium]